MAHKAKASQQQDGSVATSNDFKPLDSLAVPRFAGISTLFRLPHVSDPSGLDVAIFGVPWDGGQSYRSGSRFAPGEIRKLSSTIKPYNPSLKVNPFEQLRMADLGDSPVNPLDGAVTRELIEETVQKVLDAGAMPVAVGGDHSITLPVLRALAKKYGPVGLIQIDSHLDTAEGYFGSKYGGGTPFRRAVEESLIDTQRWIQIGIRGPAYTENDYDFVLSHGVKCLTMDLVYANGLKWVLEQLEVLRGVPFFVTFDMDGLDAAFAPGVTMPMPAGLTSLEAQTLLRHLVRFPNVVGFDVVEVQPAYDLGGVTSILAAWMTFEFLSTRGVLKQNGGTWRA